ncbi:Rqc2 family fibronectin-binding protein [Fusobacterium varium]|uniref:Rqc2 family fibronectin-binding protein n=1 Tax=Fusobacterium varium TaxID=856 RepID=UPI00242CED6D|nr:NFACT family protein [Fusobacterium varium]MCF0169386.1 fibronectin-binding domain-containing protein [Fusobacterium varium]
MFYIDGISLNKIKDELKENLLGKKINKITKNTEVSLSIYFGKTELIFSCNPSFPICYIADSKESVLENTAGLAANMKKHLLNAMLTDIQQLRFDRILCFKFAKINELGEIKNYSIYFEIMGKYSNFIFADENDKIIDLLKRFSLEENRLRALFPGLKYEQPIIEEKISPLNITEDEFNKFKNENSLLKNIEGLGKLAVQNITDFNSFTQLLNAQSQPKIFLNKGRIVLGSVLNILPKGKEYDDVLSFKSFREAINFYINSENLSSSFDTLKTQLLDNINKKVKKNMRILSLLEDEALEKQDFIKYKEQGDILAASIYTLKRGMTSLTTYDFYNNKEISIPLDPQITPQENLEKLYKKYNKLKRGMEANKRRFIEINEELNYLNSIKLFIDNSSNTDNLKLIQEELISQGYIKLQQKKGNRKKQIKEIGYGVLEFEGFKILYGRNNIENDNLTFKVASKEDIWLHSKNIPGSHVIIKANEITEEMLLKGAEVAAYFSKSSTGDKISVDYTKKRYINKPKGSKPGFVTYENEKNILIEKPNKI